MDKKIVDELMFLHSRLWVASNQILQELERCFNCVLLLSPHLLAVRFLGMNFLMGNECTIDFNKELLNLVDGKLSTPLNNGTQMGLDPAAVCVANTVEIPARSEVKTISRCY